MKIFFAVRRTGCRAAVAAATAALIMLLLLGTFFPHLGCNKEPPINAPTIPELSQYTFETTGEEFLISALDEVESVSGYALPGETAALPPKNHKQIVSSALSDTTYIYGEITPDGYGAVVTERHTYPKGILLITVRKSYGKPATRMVTETKRYVTYQDFLNDTSQQSNITETYGLSRDTLVTHVNRNGTTETFTFRLPIITRVTNPVDGSVRVTTRYGVAGTVRSEIRDGNGNLVQLRDTYGDATGALTTYTRYADGSWRNVRTIGRSDGSVYHEVTTGP